MLNRGRFDGLLSGIIRTSAFIRKENAAILRQPRLVFSLILGPFLILLIFGLGYYDRNRNLRALFVVPDQSQIATLVQRYAGEIGTQVELVGTTQDEGEALKRLERQEVDLVVAVPPDLLTKWQNNEQAVFQIYHDEIDPFQKTYVEILARRYVEALNERVLVDTAERSKVAAGNLQTDLEEARTKALGIRQALQGGDQLQARQDAANLSNDLQLLAAALSTGMLLVSDSSATSNVPPGTDQTLQWTLTQLEDIRRQLDQISIIDQSQDNSKDELATAGTIESDLNTLEDAVSQVQEVNSQVLISPFGSETHSVVKVPIDVTHFYVPAVIALLLQHIAVTIAGLSIVREQQSNAMELFRASPVSAFETLLGKYVSYLLLTGVLAIVLTALVILLLGVPMLGSWFFYALIILGVLLASLGMGFVISLLAKTDSQAVQYAMIVLLASIFFTGFFIALFRLRLPVHVISWSLPATYGTTLLQDVMLRGRSASLILLGALYAFAAFFFLL
ncbi:MAG: ABC transporter permease, partial [Candidatus Promineifilaceae bacterium]